MDQQVSPITQSVFNSLLETQTTLLAESEQRWQLARKLLMEIAAQVANEWLDKQQQSGKSLDQIPLDALTAVIRDRVARLAATQSPIKGSTPPDPDLRQKFYRLSEDHSKALTKIAELESEKQNLSNLIKSQEEKKGRAAAKTSGNQNRHYIAPDPSSPPAFYKEWVESRSFERESFVIKLMGDTGLARSPKIKDRVIERFKMGEASKSAHEMLQKMVEKGYLSLQATDGGLNGRPPDIIELAPLGQTVYLFLTGKTPAISEFVIKKDHKTDAHTLLNLEAQDWLRKAGYEILTHAPVYIRPEYTFNPDIEARRNQVTFYIESERESTKGHQKRDAKWQHCYDFTGGKFHIFCENMKSETALIREIISAIGTEKAGKARIYICNLSRVTEAYIEETGDVWTTIREETK